MKSKTIFHDFHKPPEIGKWFAIMLLVRNSVLFYNNEYNGLTLCKIRQLKILGYDPILVRNFYYNCKPQTRFTNLNKSIQICRSYNVTYL